MESVASESKVRELLSQSSKLASLQERAREMEESIRYAGSLQKSILPNQQLFKDAFADAFVMFQPKDIVSGDFYWIAQYGANIYFAVGDCTGHGVPGAMVNIAGNTILKQVIQRKGVHEPAEIIARLDEEIVALFNDNVTEGQTYDGMDIVFCKFNLEEGKGSFCGAGRPLVRVRNGEMTEFKKGLSSVGYDVAGEKKFETVEFEIEQGDIFYLFSDGYTDQFGGENVKKFNRKRFRSLLTSLFEMRMKDQQKELELSLQNWMGKQEQIDDVCVVGVKI